MKIRFKDKEINIPEELEEDTRHILGNYFGSEGNIQEIRREAEEVWLNERKLGKISKSKIEALKERLSKLLIFGY